MNDRKNSLIPIGVQNIVLDYLGEIAETKDYRNDTEGSTFFGSRLPIIAFLQHVARGEQDKAEIMLKRNPHLVFQKDRLTDFSGRKFLDISAIQYAGWAYDIYMLKMLLKYAGDDNKVLEQLNELETKGTAHGTHYDFNPLIKSIQIFVNKQKEWSREQLKKHWCAEVGLKQQLVPAHVAHEYCYPDRTIVSLGYVHEILKVTELKRCLLFGNSKRGAISWFPLTSNPGLGNDFAVTISRNDPPGAEKFSRYSDATDFAGLDTFYGRFDLEFITQLSQLRIFEYKKIKKQLQRPLLQEEKDESDMSFKFDECKMS